MYESTKSESNNLQKLASAIGLLLPVIQVFFQFFPDETKDIFLFSNYFLLISIFATLFSYILILIIRNFPWFEIPLNPHANSKYQEHLARQNALIYSIDEIKAYLKQTPFVSRPFHLNPNNIFLLSTPLALLSFILFLYLGIAIEPDQANINAVLTQIISYVLLIATSTLTLAVYHIRESNRKKQTDKQKSTVKNVIKLAYENNAFEELPHISLVAQQPQQLGYDFLQNFVFRVNSSFYIISTDQEINQIRSVKKFESYQDLMNSFINNEGSEI